MTINERSVMKSILDTLKRTCSTCGKEQKDHGESFPCGLNKSVDADMVVGSKPTVDRTMKVVSTCSKCDAPIYGCEQVQLSEVPPIKRTCGCNLDAAKSVVGQTRTT